MRTYVQELSRIFLLRYFNTIHLNMILFVNPNLDSNILYMLKRFYFKKTLNKYEIIKISTIHQTLGTTENFMNIIQEHHTLSFLEMNFT